MHSYRVIASPVGDLPQRLRHNIDRRLHEWGSPQVLDCGGAGHCLFHVVAYFCLGDAARYQECRNICVTWLQSNPNSELAQDLLQDLSAVVPHPLQNAVGTQITTLDQYCAHIRASGYGGTHHELQVLANHFQVDFHVVVANPTNAADHHVVWRRSFEPTPHEAPPVPVHVLMHLPCSQHFVAVLRESGMLPPGTSTQVQQLSQQVLGDAAVAQALWLADIAALRLQQLQAYNKEDEQEFEDDGTVHIWPSPVCQWARAGARCKTEQVARSCLCGGQYCSTHITRGQHKCSRSAHAAGLQESPSQRHRPAAASAEDADMDDIASADVMTEAASHESNTHAHVHVLSAEQLEALTQLNRTAAGDSSAPGVKWLRTIVNNLLLFPNDKRHYTIVQAKLQSRFQGKEQEFQQFKRMLHLLGFQVDPSGERLQLLCQLADKDTQGFRWIIGCLDHPDYHGQRDENGWPDGWGVKLNWDGDIVFNTQEQCGRWEAGHLQEVGSVCIDCSCFASAPLRSIVRQRRAVVLYPDGRYYTGERALSCGRYPDRMVRHGIGRMYNAQDIKTAEGPFWDDLMHGRCWLAVLPMHVEFDADFQDGDVQGLGVLTFPLMHRMYAGQFDGGARGQLGIEWDTNTGEIVNCGRWGGETFLGTCAVPRVFIQEDKYLSPAVRNAGVDVALLYKDGSYYCGGLDAQGRPHGHGAKFAGTGGVLQTGCWVAGMCKSAPAATGQSRHPVHSAAPFPPHPPADASVVNKLTGRTRRMLFIGNSLYQHATPLTCPSRDARAMQRKLGAQHNVEENLTLQQMHSAADALLASLQARDVVLFYFSGHGVEVNGQLYLSPVDCDPREIVSTFFCVNTFMRRLHNINEDIIGVVLLDCCRTSVQAQVSSRAVSMSVPSSYRDVLRRDVNQASDHHYQMVYASAPGRPAHEPAVGCGEYGYFTGALLAQLDHATRLPLRDLIDRASDVLRATAPQQVVCEITTGALMKHFKLIE